MGKLLSPFPCAPPESRLTRDVAWAATAPLAPRTPARAHTIEPNLLKWTSCRCPRPGCRACPEQGPTERALPQKKPELLRRSSRASGRLAHARVDRPLRRERRREQPHGRTLVAQPQERRSDPRRLAPQPIP